MYDGQFGASSRRGNESSELGNEKRMEVSEK